MHRTYDPLAKGLCRPTMFLMVPYDGVILNAMFSVAISIAVGQIGWLPVLAGLLHGMSALVCAVEPRAFELAQCYLQSLARRRAGNLWKGVSLCPAPLKFDALE